MVQSRCIFPSIHPLKGFSRRHDSVHLPVGVTVQGGADVRVSGNALKGFDVHIGNRRRDERMSQNVGRCSIKADGAQICVVALHLALKKTLI